MTEQVCATKVWFCQKLHHLADVSHYSHPATHPSPISHNTKQGSRLFVHLDVYNSVLNCSRIDMNRNNTLSQISCILWRDYGVRRVCSKGRESDMLQQSITLQGCVIDKLRASHKMKRCSNPPWQRLYIFLQQASSNLECCTARRSRRLWHWDVEVHDLLVQNLLMSTSSSSSLSASRSSSVTANCRDLNSSSSWA